MSSLDDESVVIAQFAINFDETCCVCAIMALLAYEYLLTVTREIALFWKRRLTGASILFFLNRYIVLALHIFNFAIAGSVSDKVSLLPSRLRVLYTLVTAEFCGVSPQSAITRAGQALAVLQYLPWAAFSALRAFALSGRHWHASLLVLILSSVPIGLNLSQFHWLAAVNDPESGCAAELTVPTELSRIFTILSRSSLIAADGLVIIITWCTTYRTTRLTAGSGGKPSFARTLLMNGTLYFVTLLVINILHLAFTLHGLVTDVIDPTSFMTLFTEPITAILVSRFLINLQEVDRDVAGVDTDPTSAAISRSGGVHFAFVGSFASSVSRGMSQALEYGSSVDLAMDGSRNEWGEEPAGGRSVSGACQSDESTL